MLPYIHKNLIVLCRITSLKTLSQVNEHCILAYFRTSSNWDPIIKALAVPQIGSSRKEFVKYCKEDSSFLTLYAYRFVLYSWCFTYNNSVQRTLTKNANLLDIEMHTLDLILNSKLSENAQTCTPLWKFYITLFSTRNVTTKQGYTGFCQFIEYLLRLGGEKSSMFDRIIGVFRRVYFDKY